MTHPSAPTGVIPGPVAYARFSRRLRALLIDAILFALVFYVGLLLIGSLQMEDAQRRSFLLIIAVGIVVYEPILVTLLGGTVGHRLTNLRVVDDVSGGNPGLLKAVARALVKDIVGWLSFATMAITRKHQALHDVLARSTVQVRDISRATATDYVSERSIDVPAGSVSRARRALVIVLYIALSYVALGIVSSALLSNACMTLRRCAGIDLMLSYGTSALWLAVSIVFVVRGWRGRLWGCRPRAVAK
jgi:uncharacterized RDD family membrane protein YckC